MCFRLFYIAVFGYGRVQGIPANKRAAAVNEKIEEMGLSQYADRPAGGYSGGNRRKLSVAMAMIGDPQVRSQTEERFGVILPEATQYFAAFRVSTCGAAQV